MQFQPREVGSMATPEDDLLYFAQKVKNAKSKQAKVRALRQLQMMVQSQLVQTQQKKDL
jgi:hypothetical protein